MSVVVAYFLPVSVFVAVTATPGSGTCPDLHRSPDRASIDHRRRSDYSRCSRRSRLGRRSNRCGLLRQRSCRHNHPERQQWNQSLQINLASSTQKTLRPHNSTIAMKRTRKIRLPRITAEMGPSVSSVRPLFRLLRCPLPAAGDAVATARRRPTPSAQRRRSSARPVRPQNRRP